MTFGDTATTIPDRAFVDCIDFTSITIPKGITSIGSSAFNGCNELRSINVDENNANYKSLNGVLFSHDNIKLTCYPAGKEETSYEIPNSVSSIDNYAFSNCNKLTSIFIIVF